MRPEATELLAVVSDLAHKLARNIRVDHLGPLLLHATKVIVLRTTSVHPQCYTALDPSQVRAQRLQNYVLNATAICSLPDLPITLCGRFE